MIIVSLLVLLSGCLQEENRPLTVCVDIKDIMAFSVDSGSIKSQEDYEKTAVESFKSVLKDYGGPEDIVFELIPASPQERKSALSRIRTEITSGKGPDVFILNCVSDRFTEALFKSPRAAMDNNIFLPLDEYIDKAKYMEWDKLSPEIMKAGENSEGQILLPLTYTFPISVFRKQDISSDLSPDMSWYDMVEHGGYTIAAISNSTVTRYTWSDYVFGQMADYSKDELLFSEEELLRWAKAQQELFGRKANGDFDSLPSCYSTSMNIGFNQGADLKFSDFYKTYSKADKLGIVPMYSTQGGVAANVLSFAGINRNTKQPQAAFLVLDILLDREVQQYSSMFKLLTEMRSIPVHQDLMQEEYPVAHWYMDNDLYTEYCSVRDQITGAKFRSELENELQLLDNECCQPGIDLNQAVSKAYTTMQMILAES